MNKGNFMKFKELDWSNSDNYQENLLYLGRNIFKIKYFFEEDQLPILSRIIQDTDELNETVNFYLDAAEEAELYLKTITTLRQRNINQHTPEDKKSFQYLMEYMSQMNEDLFGRELHNPDGFNTWLKDKILFY